MARPTWRPDVSAPEAGPPWRVASARRVTTPGGAQRRRFVAGSVLVGFLALSGMMIWIATWLSPAKPSCLVLIGAGYEDNLAIPPNVYGREGLKAFAALAGGSTPDGARTRELLHLKDAPTELRTGTAWDQDLDSFREKTLFLVLALHGGADGEGAYLLPQNADPTDPSERLRLAQVLDRLEQVPSKKKKVLLLDATQLQASWPLGMLHNDFARELEKLGPRIAEIPNLIVLSASGPDQRSWVSPEYRRTIFAHFILEGLRGAADRNDNSRVDAWELFEYVRDNVARWSWANRRAVQVPVLLPEGAEGEKRARGIDLSLTDRSYRPPDPGQTTAFDPPPELERAWERHHQLAAQVPSPATYTLHLWRQYEAVLVRYEELLTAGDFDSASAMANRLRELERAIQQGKTLELASGQNTLAMPAAAGMGALVPERAGLSADELWDAPEPDKVWARLQQAGPSDFWGKRVLRLKLCGLLLERAAQDPAKNLDRAYALLKVLDDPLSPAPTEEQFLVIAHRDLPRPLTRETGGGQLQLALRVRLLAERAALAAGDGGQAYAEQVVPWVRARIEAADQLRRPGEDHLFGDATNLDESQRLLNAAWHRYQEAQATADVLRNALAVRDRLTGSLDGYAHWLARRRTPHDAPGREADAALLKRMEDLYAGLDQLQQQLDAPPAPTTDRPVVAAPDAPRPAVNPQPGAALDVDQLARQVQELNTQFSDLQSRFQARVKQLLEATDLAALDDLEAALAVTGTDPRQRMQLLTQERRITRGVLIDTARQEEAAPSSDNGQGAELVKERGRREGRMALAVLGRPTFDRFKGAGHEDYQQVTKRLGQFATQEDWWQSLDRAGAEIGYRWQQLPGEAARLLDDYRKRDDEPGRLSLRQAAQLGRRLEGGMRLAGGVEPEDVYRKLLVQDLLLYQAQRALDDHWFSEDPAAEPYCQTAGLRYLDDAQRLAPGKQLVLLEKLDRQLKDPARLVFNGQPRLIWTSEQYQDARFTMNGARDALLPPGFAVVQVEAGPSLRLESPEPNRRQLRRVEAGKPSEPVSCRLRSPLLETAESQPPRLPKPETSRLTLTALFRGQKVVLNTPVDLYPLPETTVQQTPPPVHASVAVRASPLLQDRFGNGTGTIAIVLDCSGSMGPPAGVEFSASTKFAQATEALRDVIKRLPRGTRLSVWAFGMAGPSPNKTVEDAEKTITRIQDPITWNPDDPLLVEELLKKVSYPALEPWNQSPILRTMLEAKQDLRGAPGFKTLLVLTDGMDNRFTKDPVLRPRIKKGAAELIRDEFDGSGIVVNVVGFKPESAEEEEARRQFKVVEQLNPPGRYVEVQDVRDLAPVLNRALEQRMHYWIDGTDNRPIFGLKASGLEVSSSSANDQWYPDGLLPGSYSLRVHTDRRIDKNIVLSRGDLLLANLVPTPEGLRFERALLSRDDYPEKPWREQKGRRLAVLQNQWLPDARALQMLTTFEAAPDVNEEPLQITRPGVFWLEVSPIAEGAPSFAQRWGSTSSLPAPAWSIDVPEWPTRGAATAPFKPLVQAWWSADVDTVSSAPVWPCADCRSLRDLAGRAWRVAELDVVCESVAVEEHLVEVRPGVRQKRACQVIRLRFPPGNPVWLHVQGPQLYGQEHRLYTAAGKYTLLLWPADGSPIDRPPASVSLVSVARFKREAERLGNALKLPLDEPQVGDARPRSPLELK